MKKKDGRGFNKLDYNLNEGKVALAFIDGLWQEEQYGLIELVPA